jgi:DNA-binding SARP family transcriptional activator/streptogramin lyase
MQFRVLGSLEVIDEDGPVPLGRGKRRSLLALLLIHAREVVSQDRLIEALWGEGPPAAPRTALQVLVSDLRKELGAEILFTRGSGYVLAAEPAEVDASEFMRLLEGGKRAFDAGDMRSAEERLRSALRLWRGDPFQDVAYEDFARAEIARLEELRRAAEEELVEVELALGRGAELVPKLERLIAAHPQRERLRGQLMLALYRAQRQSEALAAYQEARAMLMEELGVEPSPALRRLQQAILNQDSELEAGSPVAHRATPRRRHLLALGLLATAAVVVAALGLGLFFALHGGSARQPVSKTVIPRRSVLAIDPASSRLIGAISLEPQPLATPVQPTDVAVGFGSVWLSDAGQQEVVRIDPTKRDVAARIGVGGDVQALALGFGSIWVADGNSATVTRIDPKRDRVTATIRLGNSGGTPNVSFAITAGAGAVWATGGDNLVERIDPRTNRVVERIAIGDPRSLTSDARFVWCGTKSGEIIRITPSKRRARVTKFASVAPGLVRLEVRGHSLWAAVPGQSFEVWQYDTRTGRLASTLVVGQVVLDLAVTRSAVWVPLYREGEVISIDPTRNTITQRIVVRPGVSFVAVDGGMVWAVVG